MAARLATYVRATNDWLKVTPDIEAESLKEALANSDGRRVLG
jgi:hypothetical protein